MCICFSKETYFNPRGGISPNIYVFPNKYISIRRVSPDDGKPHRYDLSIIDNFKKVKINFKMMLDFVQTLAYNIIKLKERGTAPRIKKEKTT